MAEKFSFEEAFKKPSETFSFEDAFKPEEGLIRQSADIPVGFVKGAVGATRSVADIFGTQNVVSQSLRGVEDYVGSLLSAQAQQNQKEVSRIMEEAKDKGVWDQVLAAVEAVKTAPLDLLSQGAGSIAPMLIGGAGARLAGAGVAGTKQVVRGIGTAMGAGATKSAIYDAVKEELGKQGFSPDVAEKAAEQAQSYGENIDQIALGALLGRLSSTTGAESALMPQLMGKISKRLAEKGIGKFTQDTLGEAGTEFLQSGQEQIAQNIALQRMGVDVPTFQGAVGAGTLGAIIGGGVGAGASVISRGKPAAAPTEEEPEAKTPVAPETEKAAFEPTTAEPIQRELEIAEARERGETLDLFPEMQPGEAIELDPAVKADIESVLQPGMTEEQARPVVQSIVDQNLKDLPTDIRQQVVDSVISDYLKKTQGAETVVEPTTIKAPIGFKYSLVESPAYEGVDPLSLEDADFELSVLLNRAEKGRLTPEVFAQSEIAKRLDTAQVMSINEGLRVDPVATVNSLAQALQKTQPIAPKQDAEPPVEPGFVRVYHSGSQGEGDFGRWVSTDKKYASNYRPNSPLFYTDLPANDPRVNNPDYADQGVAQGFTFNFELNPEEAKNLKPISREEKPKAAKPAAPAKPIEPPRVRYGFDPVAFQETGTYSLVPVDQGGALFKTRQEALQAKKFQADTRLQAVEGGYSLVQKRPDEIKADLIKAERMRKMPVAKGPLDILQFLASKGGLSPTLMSEISTDKNIRLGNRTLFAAKGKGLNESIAAEMAAEAGYINDNENLFDVINQSLTVKPRYSINDMDQVAEARYEDYLQAIEESEDAAGIIEQSGAKPGSVAAFGLPEGEPLNRLAALLTTANNLGIDVYGIEESIAARTEGLPQEQYEATVEAELERAISQAEQRGLSEFGKVPDIQSEDDLSPLKTKAQAIPTNWPSDIPTSLFRGYGREDYGSAYGMTASPIAGKGKYFAFNEDAASFYGPNIEKAEAPLKNPYVIRDGNQWVKLTKEAGWEFANPTSLPVDQVEEMTQRLQNILKDRGYDGMIVYWDYLSPYDIGPNQENYKTLNKVFGVPQVVVFERTKSDKAAKKSSGVEDGGLTPFNVVPQRYRVTGTPETEADFQALNEDIRDNKIRDYQKLRQSITDIQRRAVENKSKNLDNEIYRALYRRAEELKAEIDATKPNRSSPEDVMNVARQAFADGLMDQQTFDLFDTMYKKNPQFFNGLRLTIEQGPEGFTGQFEPIARIVRLFKSNGVISPGTARHEFTHTMEQMMTEEVRQKIVDKWLASLKKAVETDTSDQAQKYFKKVSDFLENPTQAKMNEAIAEMPSYEYYQYLTPSEYWAINAEPLMNAYLGSSWQRFKMSMKGMLQAIKKVFGLNNNSEIYTAFKNAINGERRTTEMLVDYINSNLRIYDTKKRNYAGDAAPDASWNMPPEDTFSRILGGYSKTSWIYKYQDKFIDLKDIQKAVNKKISDEQNAYQRETLYHKRVANETQKIERKMIVPLVKDMLKRKITMDEMNYYLHAKFAEERNRHIASIRPDMQDGGSGMETQVARDYLKNIPEARLKDYEAIEKQVRDVVDYFQQKMIYYGLEDKNTIKAWKDKFPHYVPLFRDDVDFVHSGTGMGQGMSSRGPMSYAATGSTKDVSSILDSVFEMAEKTIVKGEKARVGRALLGLAAANPSPDFWLPIIPEAIKNPKEVMKQLQELGATGEDIKNLMAEPKVAVVERIKDPKTKQYRNIVVYRIRPNSKFSDNVLPVRLNGKDAYIFFNPRNDRALRLAQTLKNLNIEQLDTLTQQAGKITRFIASMSTQYNPIFGMWNFMRDIQGAGFNLSTTPLKGQQAAIISDAIKMIPALYKEFRAQRLGAETQSQIAEDYREFAALGGPTGYRDQFVKLEESGRIVERTLKDLNANTLKKAVSAVGGWISDYNDTLENAIRLAAFRKAKSEAIGMTADSAANLAKELTVNFNRKGAKTPGLSALYAFFNAAIQGNARLLQTLKGPAGKKIIGGGILLGVVQAMILQAFDIDDDDIPEFTKQRNLIIPIGGGQYAMWPMPLGFNFLPTLGRLITEATYDPRFEMRKSTGKILEAFTNSFNPLGGGGFMQTISPTIIDPFVAVAQNKDAFGRPISREDRATNPTPGYLRSREQASEFGKTLAEILNYMTFGSKHTKGMISPTGDDIDYIAGQYLGGVAREAMRAKEFIQLSATGEPVEPHKVPIAGKIVGDLGAPAAVANKFYGNITRLAEHEQEIKGRIKDKESPAGYLREYPEARLFQYANKLENEISRINRTIRQLQAMEGKERQIENLKNRKTEIMKKFNERYDAAVK